MVITLKKEQPESFLDFIFPRRRAEKLEELIVDFDNQTLYHKHGKKVYDLPFDRLDQIELHGNIIYLTIVRPDNPDPLTLPFGPVANPSTVLKDLKKAWLKPIKTEEIKPPQKQYNIFTQRAFEASAKRYGINPEHAAYIGII